MRTVLLHMGDREEVSVTSNSGILFTEFTVKITDSEGNIIRDEDNSLKIGDYLKFHSYQISLPHQQLYHYRNL